jgi:hypothetical protein
VRTVGQLQDSTNNQRDEKKRRKQHESERNEKDWTAHMSQLNQVDAYSIVVWKEELSMPMH